MNLEPLWNYVLVKRLEAVTRTASGLYLPETAVDKPTEAEVIAVGPGKTLDNGTLRVPPVKPGDRILFGKYPGSDVKVDGVEYTLLRDDDIQAIVR